MFVKKNIAVSLIVMAALSASIVYADNTSPADNPNNALGQVQFSGYASTDKSERGLFTTDFIVPLYYSSNKDTLLYFNPKDTISTPFANEIHQGAGIRHIFDDSFILGFNAFFDRRQDYIDDTYVWNSQAGVGLEYLSQPLDLRTNWYKPTTRYKILGGAGPQTNTYEFTNTSLVEIPGATQENIVEPLQGLDFEAGVPVFDKYTKTRLYLGGYFYQSRLNKDVNGFRARTETKLTQWLALDTTFNSKVGNTNEFYGGLRVNLAFDLFNLFGRHGRSFFSTPSNPEANNNYLEDRIFDRVVRDIDIQSRSFTRSSGTPINNGAPVTVANLVYVNNTNSTGTQNGTLQNPYLTISQGVAAAVGGKWVYVEGQGAANYAGGIILTNSVVLWGSGYNGGFSGLAVSGAYPVVSGGTNGVALANNNTVMGLKIQGASNDGIKFAKGTTLTGTIQDNIITGNASDGIDLSGNNVGMSNFVISNNTVTSNGQQGVYGTTTNVGVGVGSVGIDLSNNSSTMTNFTISGNTVLYNGNAGLDLSFNSGSMTGFNISNNTVHDNCTTTISTVSIGDVILGYNLDLNYGSQISLSHNSGLMNDFTISNNILSANGSFSYNLNQEPSINGINSTTTTASDAAIALGANSGTMSNFIISNNISLNNTAGYLWNSFNSYYGNAGITLSANSNTITGFNISNNIFSSNEGGGSGVDLSNNSGTISGVTFLSNTITNNGENGVLLSNSGPGSMSNINFGNGATGGDNSIYGNNISSSGYYDFNNNSGISVPAKDNWWGQSGGPIAGQIHNAGASTTDTSNPLSSAP